MEEVEVNTAFEDINMFIDYFRYFVKYFIKTV